MSYFWSRWPVDHTVRFLKPLRICSHQGNHRELARRKNLGCAPCLPDHVSGHRFQECSERWKTPTISPKQDSLQTCPQL